MTPILDGDIPGDQVIEYLRFHGAYWSDAATNLEEGRHQDNIARYIELMEHGEWWESRRPIYLDARSGQVWQGADRTAAIAQVAWEKAPRIPLFKVIVEHPRDSP